MTFTLKEKRQLKDINSIGYIYEHTKTKALVAFVKNDDDNTTFSISFATPPYNNNGIAHILEHSVLNGSKKYPSKEPFVELAQGSLNTFLNAMTYSDKTVYPVASKNKKDFYNLVDVYLDAVFHPLLLNNPQILAQEGWHYHLENKQDDLIYKGVVYNEMKGAYSDPGTVLFHASKRALFPDTIYAHESGGYPLDIPSLTQEEFVSFHQTYYHPSNSFTFFYGDLNIDEQLNHLAQYFDEFDYKDIDKQVTYQKTLLQPLDIEVPYSISKEENTQQKTFLSLEFVVGESKNIKEFVYLSILHDILLGSNAAPLWKNLIESGICSDVESGISNYLPQLTFDISLSNSEKEHKETFKQIVFDTLTDLVERGIDDTLIQAAINKNKFNLKEAAIQTGFPKGIFYGIGTTNDWLYNGNLFDSLLVEDILDELENNKHVFTTLIKEKLLNNPYHLLLTGTPTPSLNDDLFNEVFEQLQHYKNQLSEVQLDELVAQTQALLKRQNEPDSKEALESIPLLTLDDIDKATKPINIIEKQVNNTTYLLHDTFTSGINYLAYYFDTKSIHTEHIPYINLYAKLLGNLSTTTYHLDELSQLQDLHTGGIHFSTNVFVENSANNSYSPKFVVKAKGFDTQMDWVIRLTHDMMLHTVFDDKDKLLEQLLKLKSRHESKFIHHSHVCATYRLRSYYSQSAKYEELLNGIDFYYFLCDLVDNYDNKFDTIIATLQSVAAQLINQSQLTIGFIGDLNSNTTQLNALENEISKLPAFAVSHAPFTAPVEPLNEGFVLAQDVQYVAQGFNYTLDAIPYTAKLRVLKNILTYSYLWNEIRVKGGAYGALTIQTRVGDFIFCSYRDPNFKQTVDVYNQAAQFINTLSLDQRELTKAIIGTFSELDKPLSPKETGEIGFMRYFTKIKEEDIQQERLDVLNTTLDELKHLATYLEHSINKDMRCVFGNQVVLNEQSHLLNSITTLIK